MLEEFDRMFNILQKKIRSTDHFCVLSGQSGGVTVDLNSSGIAGLLYFVTHIKGYILSVFSPAIP